MNNNANRKTIQSIMLEAGQRLGNHVQSTQTLSSETAADVMRRIFKLAYELEDRTIDEFMEEFISDYGITVLVDSLARVSMKRADGIESNDPRHQAWVDTATTLQQTKEELK